MMTLICDAMETLRTSVVDYKANCREVCWVGLAFYNVFYHIITLMKKRSLIKTQQSIALENTLALYYAYQPLYFLIITNSLLIVLSNLFLFWRKQTQSTSSSAKCQMRIVPGYFVFVLHFHTTNPPPIDCSSLHCNELQANIVSVL